MKKLLIFFGLTMGFGALIFGFHLCAGVLPKELGWTTRAVLLVFLPSIWFSGGYSVLFASLSAWGALLAAIFMKFRLKAFWLLSAATSLVCILVFILSFIFPVPDTSYKCSWCGEMKTGVLPLWAEFINREMAGSLLLIGLVLVIVGVLSNHAAKILKKRNAGQLEEDR